MRPGLYRLRGRRPADRGRAPQALQRHFLDEIEKAHPDVFNILLQLLDDGRLTDNQGRTVDFRNTVVIMTSNIGSAVFDEADRNEQEKAEAVRGLLRAHFRPEFLNRIDEVVVFHPLSRKHIRQIVDVQLRLVEKRLAERRLELELTPAAKDLLAERGYDPVFGARPLKRVIQQLVLDPLAYKIIAGDITDGAKVEVDVEGDGLAFRAE